MKHVVLFPTDLQESEYAFASFRLKPDGTLLRDGEEIHLTPKGLAALRVLLAHAGQIITPRQLRHALWGDVHVTAESVPRCVSSLRAALLPDDCIQTVYKQGYRMTAQVRAIEPAAVETAPRLAVLPFVTGLGVAEHLGAAVAEEAIVRLSRAFTGRSVPFTILARDSVFTMAQQGCTARQVGEALEADLVLTGSLRAMGTQYRLRAEMIRVADDAQIWVEDFMVPQSRLAGLESRLADRLVARLDSGLNSIGLAAAAEEPREPENDSVRREAYDRFLRARHERRGSQGRRMQDGLQNLLRATELDPALMPAQLDLINHCITQTLYGFLSPAVAAEQARRAARAIPRDDESAAAVLPALGWIRFHVDRNLESALHAFENSSFLPHDPEVTRSRTAFALSRHRFDEAIELIESALREDPYSPWLHARLGWALHLARRPQKSLEQIEYALAHFPEHEGVVVYGSMILAFHGKAERALDLAAQAEQLLPLCDIVTAVRGYALARIGRTEDAAAVVEQLQSLGRERYVLNSFTPAISVALGDLETAITELRSAEEARCPWFFQALADPRLDALRGHPEFERMHRTLAEMEARVVRDRSTRLAQFPPPGSQLLEVNR
jgi:DNA-binding winged helix-turn-helix (wHTH) protein/tetratricopeptide (TPR) repeat protein